MHPSTQKPHPAPQISPRGVRRRPGQDEEFWPRTKQIPAQPEAELLPKEGLSLGTGHLAVCHLCRWHCLSRRWHWHISRGVTAACPPVSHTQRDVTRAQMSHPDTHRDTPRPPPAAAAAPGHCPARARSRRHRSAPPPPPPRGPGAVRGRERRPRHLPVRPSRVSHLSQVRRSPSELRGTLRTLGLP